MWPVGKISCRTTRPKLVANSAERVGVTGHIGLPIAINLKNGLIEKGVSSMIRACRRAARKLLTLFRKFLMNPSVEKKVAGEQRC